MRLSPSLVALALLVSAPGCDRCAAPREGGARKAAAIEVRDGLGREVRLARPARRIAALSPSNNEILFALGCGPRVVLRDRASDHPPAVRALPATDAFRISPEHIAGFRPDLVLMSHFDASRAAALGAIGLKVAVFDPKSVKRVLEDIRSIAILCGASGAAVALIAGLRRRIDAVTARVRARSRPIVYVELDGSDPAKPWTAGRGSLVDDLLRLAGGRNLFGALPRPYVQVSAEEVIRSSPEVILVGGRAGDPDRGEAIRARAGWGGVAAVRSRRIIASIDPGLYSRPGPRIADGLERLARALHPGAFSK